MFTANKRSDRMMWKCVYLLLLASSITNFRKVKAFINCYSGEYYDTGKVEIGKECKSESENLGESLFPVEECNEKMVFDPDLDDLNDINGIVEHRRTAAKSLIELLQNRRITYGCGIVGIEGKFYGNNNNTRHLFRRCVVLIGDADAGCKTDTLKMWSRDGSSWSQFVAWMAIGFSEDTLVEGCYCTGMTCNNGSKTLPTSAPTIETESIVTTPFNNERSTENGHSRGVPSKIDTLFTPIFALLVLQC